MSEIKNSDRQCCYTCNNLYFEIDKGDCCKATGETVKVWNDCKTGKFEYQRTAGE